MKIGDTLQAAVWLSGREGPGLCRQFEADLGQALAAECARHGLAHEPLRFFELRPGDPYVPPVPPHIDGPDIRLLVAEAETTGRRLVAAKSFLADLDFRDLERLRAITRASFARRHPGGSLSDADCDGIIEEIGPEAAMDAVRRAVDARVLH